MAITDLTNTKWILNDDWTSTRGYGNFTVNLTYNNNNYMYFYIGYNPALGGSEANVIGLDDGSHFFSGEVITFTITGGTDATNASLISWLETNATQVVEETTPPTKIKSPVIVIKQKVKQVVIDNANMTIDIYTKEVPATEATVTITNTATNSKYTAYINDNEYIVGPNSSITITVPIGTILEFAGLDVTSGMGYWAHTSSTGDITHDSSPYMTYTINGSGTITGYIYDAD